MNQGTFLPEVGLTKKIYNAIPVAPIEFKVFLKQFNKYKKFQGKLQREILKLSSVWRF